MNSEVSLILTGGEGPEKPVLKEYSTIIAADSGYDLAKRLGLDVDLVVGDLDSTAYRDEIIAKGFEPCPRDKDESDSELAILKLPTKAYDLVGGGGGRLDHLFSLIALFEKYWPPRYWFTSSDFIISVDNSLRLNLPLQSDIRFISLGAYATVNCTDLVWPLEDFQLNQKSLSLSNRNTVGSINIRTRGRILVRLDISLAPFVLENFASGC